MDNISVKWLECKKEIQNNCNNTVYTTWIEPMHLSSMDLDEGKAVIITINKVSAGITMKRYKTLIEDAIFKIFNKKVSIQVVGQEDANVKKANKSDNTNNIQLQKSLNSNSSQMDEFEFNQDYTFENFVVGPSNQLAFNASVQIANNPGISFNPLFLYGPSGVGKTHLMCAIGRHIKKNDFSKRIVYVSSEKFTNDFIYSIKLGSTEYFRNIYRNTDVLMVDDIQFIESKQSVQEEFFHTFEELWRLKKQIILCSDRPPSEIKNIDSRLTSRFQGGLNIDIQPPDLETRIAIILKVIETEGIDGIEIPNEVINFIAENSTSNVRELRGMLNAVLMKTIITNEIPTIESVKECIPGLSKASAVEITAEVIKSAVCSYFDISIEDIESKKRTKTLATPRQIAMYLCRDMTGLSLPKIGEYFGNRDHTTVMHACEKISTMITEDDHFRKVISELRSSIRA